MHKPSCRLGILVFILWGTSVFAQSDKPETTVAQRQVIVSGGYGFPSILRAFLRYETPIDSFGLSGYGPLIFKGEYMLNHRLGIGLSIHHNYTHVTWEDVGAKPGGGWQFYEFGVKVRELSGCIRANYHYYNRKKLDAYAGLGVGYGYISAEAYSKVPNSSFYSFYEFPRPYVFEVSTGLRYFPTKTFGFFTELGLGKVWFLYKKYFIPDSIIQAGIALRL